MNSELKFLYQQLNVFLWHLADNEFPRTIYFFGYCPCTSFNQLMLTLEKLSNALHTVLVKFLVLYFLSLIHVYCLIKLLYTCIYTAYILHYCSKAWNHMTWHFDITLSEKKGRKLCRSLSMVPSSIQYIFCTFIWKGVYSVLTLEANYRYERGP